MAILNKVLNILILVMAIVAAAFAFKLNEKSKELKGNHDNLIGAVQQVSTTIDEAGGTKTAKMTAKKGDLETLQGQLSDLIEQRNHLAQTIKDLSDSLNKTDVDAESLKGLSDDSYQTVAQASVDHAKSITSRHAVVVNAVKTWGESIGTTVNTAQLKTLDSYKPVLEEMGKNVAAVQSKAQKIVDGIEAAAGKLENYSFETQFSGLNDSADIDSTLETLAADMTKINDEMAKVNAVKDELSETQQKLDEANGTIKEKVNFITQNAQLLAEKDAEIITLKEKITKYEEINENFDLNEKAVFTVADVNNDWDIVVFELGEEKMVLNADLVVARGNEYIGSINVTKVDQDEGRAVAEIKSLLTKNKIQVGDTIFVNK